MIWAFVLLVLVAALYRIMPNRPLGFAPQIAMALFGGAIIKDKKWAIALPLLSMLVSDVLYQMLYTAGLTDIKGFYSGQFLNYLLFAGITVLGFTMKKVNTVNVLGYSLLAPTLFFLASNFTVWAGSGGLQRSKTFAGLIQCYADGLPFYKGGLASSLIFGAILFGGHFLLTKKSSSIIAAE